MIATAATVPALEAILFRETGTFGIRRHTASRSKLRREAVTVATPWGPVKAKKGWRDGLTIVTPEYEDCARVAREHGVPLREVYSRRQLIARIRASVNAAVPAVPPRSGVSTRRSVNTASIARRIRLGRSPSRQSP